MASRLRGRVSLQLYSQSLLLLSLPVRKNDASITKRVRYPSLVHVIGRSLKNGHITGNPFFNAMFIEYMNVRQGAFSFAFAIAFALFFPRGFLFFPSRRPEMLLHQIDISCVRGSKRTTDKPIASSYAGCWPFLHRRSRLFVYIIFRVIRTWGIVIFLSRRFCLGSIVVVILFVGFWFSFLGPFLGSSFCNFWTAFLRRFVGR